jgi:hypothetical protein
VSPTGSTENEIARVAARKLASDVREPSTVVVVTACPLHKRAFACPHCDGDGYRRLPREVYEAKREARRAQLRRACGTRDTTTVGLWAIDG